MKKYVLAVVAAVLALLASLIFLLSKKRLYLKLDLRTDRNGQEDKEAGIEEDAN